MRGVIVKPKSILLLVVAGGCGLIAALGVTQRLTITQAGTGGRQPQPLRSVVVAEVDAESGAQLKPEMLRIAQFPDNDLPEGTFSSLEEVTGKSLRFPIFKGEVVLAGKLGGENTLVALPKNLPPGMRAGTARVAEDDARMQGLINPGNHVDVLWLPSRPDLQGSSVKTLLQDVTVLAVGQRINRAGSIDGSGPRETSDSNEQNYTLLLTAEQNRRLVAASSLGKIRLVLRGEGDTAVEEVDEAYLDELLGLKPRLAQRPAPTVEKPVEPEPEFYEIEIIKGGEVSTESLNISHGKPVQPVPDEAD
jgi:pilus assembly protein CpaB